MSVLDRIVTQTILCFWLTGIGVMSILMSRGTFSPECGECSVTDCLDVVGKSMAELGNIIPCAV